MRIIKMITIQKIALICYQIVSSNLFCKEMYRVQSGEFVCGYWGLSPPGMIFS